MYASAIPVSANENSQLLGESSIQNLFSHHQEFQSNFDGYKINHAFDLSALRDVEMYILFGTWCHDSQREVPRMLRILKEFQVPQNQIILIGLDFKKNEPMNRGKGFNITNTPTFVIVKNDKELGRIIERPDISLESDLMKILALE